MDPVALSFYAVVCGLVGALVPLLRNIWLRLVIGGCVGIVAAALLPVLRGLLGS